jgi:S1-C subfamily serine protease
MSSLTEWKVPSSAQPRAEDYAFDLERVLNSVVGLHAIIPGDAFTAETLGTERAGNGVVIGDGLVLTIEPLPLGSSASAAIDSRVVVGGVGGRTRSLAGHIVAKEAFAGYWEYALDEAIFTGPAHPNWGGTGLISERGELLGIGSLQLERGNDKATEHLNMIVPIDLLKPILSDLTKFGRVNKPARPWLGLFSTEIDGRGVVAGLSPKGPAAQAQLKTGDVPIHVALKSSDRARFLRTPRMH